MPDKPKIIFIGDYCRVDYLSLLKDTVPVLDIYFLYFTSAVEETNKLYQWSGKAIYWSGFKDTNELLHSIQPAKVVFLYIESYNHVILNLACKQTGIPTYHLEHGLRADYVVGFDPTISPSPKRSILSKLREGLRILSQFKARLKSRRFLNNSIKSLPPDDAAFIRHFMEVRSQNNYLETFRQIKSSKRTPQVYISFSPKIFGVHQHHDGLKENQPVHFIGIPYFDALANIKANKAEKLILFIDQPLVEHHLLKWTNTDKKHLLDNLYRIFKMYNYKLFVKPHPKQKVLYWADPAYKDVIALVNEHQLPELASRVAIIIGFYSTLLMPFAAMAHTTLVTLENHPAGKLDVSKSFIDAGVAHPIYDLDELPWALKNIKLLHQQQKPNKKKFESDWLYKFDGKAGERLRNILLNDSL